jgi:hypothetical protein
MMPQTKAALDRTREIIRLQEDMRTLGFDWLSDLVRCTHQAFIGSREELLTILRRCIVDGGAGPNECTALYERFSLPPEMLVRSQFERLPVEDVARHIRDRANHLLESLPDNYARRFDSI